MPRTIRKLDDAEPLQPQYSVDSYGSMMQIPPNVNTQMSLGRSVSMSQLGAGQVPYAASGMGGGSLSGSGSASGGAGGYLFDSTMSAMIAERERNFFKEISKNPQLRDQHPLMHLISAHQKLKMADEASGVVASKASSQKKSLFGTRYGKQSGDKFDALGNIYGQELPYMFKGELVLPSEWRKQKEAKEEAARAAKRERMRQKKAREAAMNAPTMAVGADGQLEEVPNEAKLQPLYNEEGQFSMFAEEPVVDVTSTKSAQKHREFLRDTLRKLEGEVDKSADYLPGGALAVPEKGKGTRSSSKGVGGSGPASTAAAKALSAAAATAAAAAGIGAVGVAESKSAYHDAASAGAKTVKIAAPPILAPLAPAPPGSPTQYDDENSLDRFFQLANAGGDALPPRADVKSAGIRDARTADSSRPSTTAASKRGVAETTTFGGGGAVTEHHYSSTHAAAVVSFSGLPDLAGDHSVLSLGSFSAADSIDSTPLHSLQGGQGHMVTIVGSTTVMDYTPREATQSIVGAGAGAGSGIFFEASDAAPSHAQHLLVHWGSDHVHSETRDESLLALRGQSPAALADALLNEHKQGLE